MKQLNLKEKNKLFERIIQIVDLKGFKSINDFALNGLKYASPEKINRLKKNNNKPSYETILDISNLFDEISLDWLLTGRGEMLRGKENQEKAIQNQKEFRVSSSEEKNKILEEKLAEKDKAIEELKESIKLITTDKDKQIASLQSNMDIIIKAKDELLKAREEMIKQKEEALRNKDEVIATHKQHIKEIIKNRDVIQEIGITPAENTTTVNKEEMLSSITSTKKILAPQVKPDTRKTLRSK